MMKKIVLIMLAVAFMASASMAKSKGPKAQKISGYVNDAKCAAKGGEVNGDCAKKCIAGGEKAVLVTDKGHKVLAIDNQDAVKGHEGHHVKVTGHVNGDSIHVDKVAMLKQAKPAKQKGEHGM